MNAAAVDRDFGKNSSQGAAAILSIAALPKFVLADQVSATALRINGTSGSGSLMPPLVAKA